MIDLHTHTTFSDGTKTPEQLILLAKQVGLKAIAISDHDNISAIEPASYFAKIHNIELINGIEFSSSFENKEIHLLGYFININNPDLLTQIHLLEVSRNARNLEIVSKLQNLNINIDLDFIRSFMSDSSSIITKTHFAQAIVKKGFANSIEQAFSMYLAPNKPAYVPRQLLPFQDAINLIHKACGICVLAHPFSYGFSTKDLENIIPKLKQYGLDGIECYYSNHTIKQTNYLLNLANKHNLKVSAGSDFHGDNRPSVTLGNIFVSKQVDYDILQKLKP